jgi:sensor domain CHASE-containing protein
MPLTIAAILWAIFVFTYFLVGHRFWEIEIEDMQQNVQRANDSRGDILRTLSSKGGDWSNWTDTYDFMAGTFPDYTSENFGPTLHTLQELDLNLMMFVHPNGEVAYGEAFDLAKGESVPIPSDLVDLLVPGSPLLGGSTSIESTTGLILLAKAPLLFASRPIYTSEGTGPSQGTLIFGRFLDEELIARLAGETHLSLKYTPIDGSLPTGQQSGIVERASRESAPLVEASGVDSLHGYLVLKDYRGEPVLLQDVETSRKIYRQGQSTLAIFGLTFLSIGLIGAVGAHQYTKRLLRSRQERREAEIRLQTAVEHSNDGFIIVDARDLRLLEANPAFLSMSGLNPTGLTSANLRSLFEVSEDVLTQWAATS